MGSDDHEQKIVNFNTDTKSVVINPLKGKVGSPRLFVHEICSREDEQLGLEVCAAVLSDRNVLRKRFLEGVPLSYPALTLTPIAEDDAPASQNALPRDDQGEWVSAISEVGADEVVGKPFLALHCIAAP